MKPLTPSPLFERPLEIPFDIPFDNADAFYEQLLDAHSGLTREASEALNARLILLLAHQIRDNAVLTHCIKAAQQ
jgi:Protein of unknown function (DUF2783)